MLVPTTLKGLFACACTVVLLFAGDAGASASPTPRQFMASTRTDLRAGDAEPQTANLTPGGLVLTPTAAPGAIFQPLKPHLADDPHHAAGQAATTATSPNGHTLLILTSGYNRVRDAEGKSVPADSEEYVFVEDISQGAPRQVQVIKIPNSFMGLAFAPDGRHFYVSGGVDDDVHAYARDALGRWVEEGKAIALMHAQGVGLSVRPQAAGLAISADGHTLAVADFYNDSLSLVHLPSRKVDEVPLRPGRINPKLAGKAGGEYPFWVAIRGNQTAYVSSMRDREVDVVRLGTHPSVVKRIPVPGNPNRLLLANDGTRLFVACDNEAMLAIIDTRHNRLVDTLRTTAPSARNGMPTYFHGTAPNSLALSPDGTRLYITNGGTNSVAIVGLDRPHPEVLGLIPTGYYPNSVSTGDGGRWLYVVNGKSVPGANPCNFAEAADATGSRCTPTQANNDYILQRSQAGFLALPIPSAGSLEQLTARVLYNNRFDYRESSADRTVMDFLKDHIRHVIYIVRENRSYDQMLGDLGEGNGEPDLAEFGAAVTPNAHALARQFVDFDNFYDVGEVSGNGWPWSTSARESDLGAKALALSYAHRGLSYDWEGTNRNVDVGIGTLAGRIRVFPAYPRDPDLLPGINNVAAPDGPQGQFQRGYLWDAVLRKGLSVRNYGFFIDLQRYFLSAARGGLPLLREPWRTRTQVAWSADPQLAPRTDPYFYGFDNRVPDYWRYRAWQREFRAYVRDGHLPTLELVRFMHDHTGNFGNAIDGVNTPPRQVADNDWATGTLIETVAHSPYAASTLVFVVEDDAQDGPDHVDAHRSVAFIAGPYVRRDSVDSTRYSTVNLLRTIEDVLGTGPMTLNDAYARPMASAFDIHQGADWTYTGIWAQPLTATRLPQPAGSTGHAIWHEAHDAHWWAAQTRGYDWTQEDRIPTRDYDHVLWRGLMRSHPYPRTPGTAGTSSPAPESAANRR